MSRRCLGSVSGAACSSGSPAEDTASHAAAAAAVSSRSQTYGQHLQDTSPTLHRHFRDAPRHFSDTSPTLLRDSSRSQTGGGMALRQRCSTSRASERDPVSRLSLGCTSDLGEISARSRRDLASERDPVPSCAPRGRQRIATPETRSTAPRRQTSLYGRETEAAWRRSKPGREATATAATRACAPPTQCKLYLGHISARSRPHLGHILGRSRADLG